MKKYNQNEEPKAVAETSIAYSTEPLPNIQCGNVNSRKNTQPCVFTEEEFDKVIKHSERSGNATPAEIKQFFAQWMH